MPLIYLYLQPPIFLFLPYLYCSFSYLRLSFLLLHLIASFILGKPELLITSLLFKMLVSFIQKYFSTSSLFPSIKTNYWEKRGVGSQCSMVLRFNLGKRKKFWLQAAWLSWLEHCSLTKSLQIQFLAWAYTWVASLNYGSSTCDP